MHVLGRPQGKDHAVGIAKAHIRAILLPHNDNFLADFKVSSTQALDTDTVV